MEEGKDTIPRPESPQFCGGKKLKKKGVQNSLKSASNAGDNFRRNGKLHFDEEVPFLSVVERQAKFCQAETKDERNFPVDRDPIKTEQGDPDASPTIV